MMVGHDLRDDEARMGRRDGLRGAEDEVHAEPTDPQAWRGSIDQGIKRQDGERLF